MKRWSRVLAGAVALLLALVLFTAWALESGGVAIVETRASDGSMRETHVWFVESGGELWLEAGAPTNPWYLDIQRDPRLRLRAGAQSGVYTARPVPEEAAHDRLRAALRAKYGLRDWWVGCLVDSSASVPVRLVPSDRAAEAG